MMRLGIKRISLFLLIIYSISSLLGISSSALEDVDSVPAMSSEYECGLYDNNDVNVSSRIYELLFGKNKKSGEPMYLIPGGDVFGIRIKEEFVSVSDASEGSAFKRGDKIISIDGKKIETAENISEALDECEGKSVKINIIRCGESMCLTVVPKYENGKYRLGVTLRKFASGIGTITFIDPNTHVFGGLGHGVNEADSGGLVSVKSGEVCGVVLGGVNRGKVGKPGELSGILNKNTLGSIYTNTECGVFGELSKLGSDTEAIPVGKKEELKLGEAEIISTVRNGKKSSYKIEILEINTNAEGSKCFKIKVTDPLLIALTGGIVRGQSGSPIIQDGKLVGAVTHVMIADPTEGYGIFIENMLNSAENVTGQRAA